MSTPSVVKARRFLVNRIIDQAKRSNLALSEVETLMLAFSAASASPAERQAAAVFDRDYDKAEYESRIARLFQDVYAMDKSLGRTEIWEQALDSLANEDMYLAVIIRKTGIRQAPVPWYLPKLSSLREFVPGIAMGLAGILVAFTPLGERLVPNPILRVVVALCCWLSPWLISKLAKGPADEEPGIPEDGAHQR
jgi:hypothetical protein